MPPASPLADTTLRKGDVVMTATGLRVFRGARHYPFVAEDFQPIAYVGKIPHRSALIAIEKAIVKADGSASLASDSPVMASDAAGAASRIGQVGEPNRP